MNNKIFSAILFTVGAAIGSMVTWKIVKTKYEHIAQEEIDSVKEEFSRLTKLMQKDIDACRKITESYKKDEKDEDDYDLNEDDIDFSEQEMIDYYKIASQYNSSDNDDYKKEEKGGNGEDDEVTYINGPYVISPEDFANSSYGYSAQPLDYFSDGILADGWGVELDIDETIGEDSLNHFGEYAEDIVYVRNERTETDYEVTKDPRTYEEAIRTNPNPYYGQ